MNTDRLHDYDDIITLPHHVSSRHPHMTMSNRAAQFSPFAALTGYGDTIRETARLTDQKPELSESERAELDYRLQAILALSGTSVLSIRARIRKRMAEHFAPFADRSEELMTAAGKSFCRIKHRSIWTVSWIFQNVNETALTIPHNQSALF